MSTFQAQREKQIQRNQQLLLAANGLEDDTVILTRVSERGYEISGLGSPITKLVHDVSQSTTDAILDTSEDYNWE